MVATQRSGEIAARPLPSLLIDLHNEGVTGALALRRAGVLKTIDLLRGEPVRVTSTLRDETLGHFLVKSGVISEAQHREGVHAAAQSRARLGETLVAMGVLRNEQLTELLHHQERAKLVAALRWPQGSWRFEAAAVEPTGVRLPLVDLVLTGLRDTGATELDRLRRFDGASYELTPRGRQLEPELRRIFGETVADALVRGGAIAAIERACGDRFRARNALDAMELCGGISGERLPAGVVAASAAARAMKSDAREISSPAMAQGEALLPRGVAPRRGAPIPRIVDHAGMEPASGQPVRTPSGAVPAPAATATPAALATPSTTTPSTTAPSTTAPGKLPSILRSAPTTNAPAAPAARDVQPGLSRPSAATAPAGVVTTAARLTPSGRVATARPAGAATAAPPRTEPLPGPPRPPATFAAHSRAAVYLPSPTPRPAAPPTAGDDRGALDDDDEPEVEISAASSADFSLELSVELELQPSVELDLDSDIEDSAEASAEAEAADRNRDRDQTRTTTRREVWLPRADTGERTPFLPRTLTGAAQSRTASPWAQPASPLYDLLFDEPAAAADEGAIPLTAMDASASANSGQVSTGELDAANEHSEAAMRMRRALVAEAQRIRTADLYTILMVDRGASEAEISAAISERQRAFSRDYYSRFALGFDRPRLEEVLAAYAGARNTLLDDEARRAYDLALAGVSPSSDAAAHTLDAEVAFREVEDLLSRQRFAEAIEHLERLVIRAPAQADFHAALGWAHWLYKGPSVSAGDAARPHLNRALEIDPEHISAHVRRGIVGTLLGEDDAEVLFHLERALELQPARADALEHLEPILIRRGELRRLERLYKRLLFRLSTNFRVRAAEIWLSLARLYADQLDEHEAAAVAISNAETLAPGSPHVAEVAQQVRDATIAPRHPLEAARARLRRTRDLGAAAELIRSAGETGQHDAAFLAAATMVALGTADVKMVQTYERHRPRGPRLPEEPLTAEHWNKLRHPDDVSDLGLLIDIVAPAVHRFAPIDLVDAGIEPSMLVAEHELPVAFGRVRKRLAHLLGVALPRVYARPELERHIQLVACDPPALIAGDEALTAPERTELVCRLARAMSHAHPGRAVGGSRSGTVMRAIVLAVIREASCSSIGEREAQAADADAALDILSIEARGNARAAALRLLARGNGLNLSVWSASLPRTADRAGLLLCGDIPTALAVAKESGHLERDLVEFAFSAEHAALRASLGLAVDPA
jgi:tetratricopeptide (TPR) repeat protein